MNSIFQLYSLGVSTNRDEWLYDLDPNVLRKKVSRLIAGYNSHKADAKEFSSAIKWSETLKRRAARGAREFLTPSLIRRASYRPFYSLNLYQSELFIDRPGAAATMFPPGKDNVAIRFSDIGSRTGYVTLAVDEIADLHFGAAVDAYQQVPLWVYKEGQQRQSNVSDWAVNNFRKHYQDNHQRTGRQKGKEDIFHYIYGILHDPIYREKYALNLKREFPRIPFYKDFWQWAEWPRS